MDLSKISFSVSQHAWDRACAAEPSVPLRAIESVVIQEIQSGVLLGGQAGNDFLIKPTRSLFNGYVFVCTHMGDRRYVNVRTVLKEEHAIANQCVFFPLQSERKDRRFKTKLNRKQKLRYKFDDDDWSDNE